MTPQLQEISNLLPDALPIAQTLLDQGQSALFSDWDPPGESIAAKKSFLKQLCAVETNYPGGFAQYLDNARNLLEASRQGRNPFEGFTPEAPALTDLTQFDDHYDEMEARGQAHFDRVGVVLVAGGLGERLGHDGIKLDLPVEILTHTSYLAHYAQCLLAMQARMPVPKPVPLVIMVSEDTRAPTLQALEDNQYFGLDPQQVHILKQELVPAFTDNHAQLAKDGPYSLLLKPHGHGDVHMLLHQSGTARKLMEQGIEHLVFIQDTNGQVFNAIPAAIGASVAKNYDFNSLAVNRVPGEAVGGLARLVSDDRALTLNIEYNQLDPLLRDTISPEGDVPGDNGFSLFPGNINILVIRMASYVEILERTQGIIAEFVNPKYADDSRDSFKKPARLETMMQDLPKLFGPEQSVGVTIFHRAWCFSPNKNHVTDAAAKHRAGSPPESAASAESDFYLAGRMKLEAAGMTVETEPAREILGVPFCNGPRVLLRPGFALTLREVREKIQGGHISGSATLILDGPDIHLDHVTLSPGTALQVEAAPGAHVTLHDTLDTSPGYLLKEMSEAECNAPDTPSHLKMRGYTFTPGHRHLLRFTTPGTHNVNLSTRP